MGTAVYGTDLPPGENVEDWKSIEIDVRHGAEHVPAAFSRTAIQQS